MNNKKKQKLIVILAIGLLVMLGSSTHAQLLSWESVPKINLGDKLKVYWDVSDSTKGNNLQIAKKHGFYGVAQLNTYADYPDNQKRNITNWIKGGYSNPWIKPPFFEEIIRRNISNLGPDDIYLNDIEVNLQGNIREQWMATRTFNYDGSSSFEEFEENYYKAMAEWYYLPLIWTKQRYPRTSVGLYGLQPFRRDYWGSIGKSVLEIDGAHKYDIKLWKFIDPYVDYYSASVYLFYDNNSSYYYLMSNIENNFLKTRKFGNKPVYAFEWLRFHTSNELLANVQIGPELVEAMAILPFFSGAEGIVLYGWEPQIKQVGFHPYSNLELFVNSIKRIEPLSKIISNGKLIIEKTASELWNSKLPIIRRIESSPDECVVMALDPWLDEDEERSLKTTCGNSELTVSLKAKKITIISVKHGEVRYY